MLDDPEVDHDVGLVAARVGAHLGQELRLAAQLAREPLDGLGDLRDGRGEGLEGVLVLRRLALRVHSALVQVLDQPAALRRRPLVRPFKLLSLLLELVELLLAALDLHVELVQVVEHLEVLVLVLDELLHKRVDVRDLRRLLDLGESFLITLNLLHARVDGRLVLREPPMPLDHRLLQLHLVFHRHLAALRAVHHLLALAREEVLTLPILLELATELLPLDLELVLLALGGDLELLDLALRLVARLVRHVGYLDDLRHPLLLLAQLMLQLLVDAVEDNALPAQIVDLLAQILVGGDRLVELDQRAMQTMLEHLDLLADRLVLLLRRIVAAHIAALREDAFAHGARAHVELVRLLLLELD